MCELAVCEMIHPKIHGNDEYMGHYMISWFISLDDFAKTEEYQTTLQLMQDFYWKRETSPPHPFLRAFWNIVANKKYYQLQIVEGRETLDGQQTAIIKTFWLRIFQRKWRNICRDRKHALEKIKYLHHREITGFWNHH